MWLQKTEADEVGASAGSVLFPNKLASNSHIFLTCSWTPQKISRVFYAHKSTVGLLNVNLARGGEALWRHSTQAVVRLSRPLELFARPLAGCGSCANQSFRDVKETLLGFLSYVSRDLWAVPRLFLFDFWKQTINTVMTGPSCGIANEARASKYLAFLGQKQLRRMQL